jgi:hypothetical protein
MMMSWVSYQGGGWVVAEGAGRNNNFPTSED